MLKLWFGVGALSNQELEAITLSECAISISIGALKRVCLEVGRGGGRGRVVKILVPQDDVAGGRKIASNLGISRKEHAHGRH